jgi:hypothetical protein
MESDDMKKQLLESLNDYTEENADDILLKIYHCKLLQVEFGTEEKKEVGRNLKYRLEEIFDFLGDFECNFNSKKAESPLIYRSALQILMDDYAYFPTDDADETLKDIIGQIDIFVEETVSVLDGAIEAWKSYLLTEGEINESTVY